MLFDMFDGMIDGFFTDADRERYELCYQAIPKLIKHGIKLVEDIDWKHLSDWKTDYGELPETWEFVVEALGDVEIEVQQCTVVVDETIEIVHWLQTLDWKAFWKTIKNNLLHNPILMAGALAGVVSLCLTTHNYYGAGKDLAMFFNSIFKSDLEDDMYVME